MRYPEGHKEMVRERIVAAAARSIRHQGIGGPSIPALMDQVGLTHGGFYAHFKDRDALMAAAVLAAAQQTEQRVFSDLHGISDILDEYLSPAHVSDPSDGCVIASLGTEGPRQHTSIREAFAAATRGVLSAVERRLHPRRPSADIHDDTLVFASTMVGAVVLARLVEDAALRDRILVSVRELLSN